MIRILSALFLLIFSINFNLYASCVKCEIKKSVNQFIKTHPDINAVYQFSQKNKTIVKGSTGSASIARDIKLEPNQKMLLASGTKNIIATVILRLEEQGLLRVEDTLDKIFPPEAEIWKIDNHCDKVFPKWAKKVKIHDLLIHSSGIEEYVTRINIDPNNSHEAINKQIIRFVASKKLLFTPGDKAHYCNTNYLILGMIIEKITGQNLANYLQTSLFKPLGMKNTHLASLQEAIEYKAGKLNGYPDLYFAHYDKQNSKFLLKPASTSFFFVPFSDGGIISNTDDMITWVYSLHNGKILNKCSYDKMMTPYIDSSDGNRKIGYGIFIANINGENVYYHSGRALGARSETGYIPSKEIGFSIISNIMPLMSQEELSKINTTNSFSQVDIFFFLQDVLQSLKKVNDKNIAKHSKDS